LDSKYDNKTQAVPDFSMTKASTHDIKVELCVHLLDDEIGYNDEIEDSHEIEKFNEALKISFKFYSNSEIYLADFSIITFLLSTMPRKYLRRKEPKINIRPKISKADYRRQIKREIKRGRKLKEKRLKIEYAELLESINIFNISIA
jgi:hypothetical protein